MKNIYFLSIFLLLYNMKNMTEENNKNEVAYITFLNKHVFFQSEESRKRFFDFGPHGVILIKPNKFIMRDLTSSYVSFDLAINDRKETIKIPLYAITNIEIYIDNSSSPAFVFSKNFNEKYETKNIDISGIKAAAKIFKKEKRKAPKPSIIWFEDISKT